MKTEGFDYNSYCGLYCGACELLNLHREAQKQGRKAEWSDLPAPLRDNIPRAEVVCHGCRTETVFAGCRGCRIRHCARSKGVEACPECAEFPCELVQAMRERLPAIRDILPHTAEIFGDVDQAREKDVESWIKSRQSRWKCPSCGAPFTWYQKLCRECGTYLKVVRGH